jgi:hypothetical protein
MMRRQATNDFGDCAMHHVCAMTERILSRIDMYCVQGICPFVLLLFG